jgi:BirA family transcriptional regulator, biotin operon repressor / biotin---[acetyl-CoA-carboxylase] ligase
MTVPQRFPHAAYRLVLRETVGSTNDEAKQLAREGATEGTVVWALAQTAGRGRRGRFWFSPRGNLYASLVLRPACPPDRAAQLGFVAALAVSDALREQVPDLGPLACKWPNDVLASGRKIAGVLLESEMSKGENLDFLIVGVGINLVSSPTDAAFPATSIAGEGHAPPTAKLALEAFVRHFAAWAQRWKAEGFSSVRNAWRMRAIGFGEQIQVRLDTATLQGKFIDIDQQGTLLLETEGELRRISAGDVFPVC